MSDQNAYYTDPHIAAIAAVAHDANARYCATLGDLSQPRWEMADQWQRDSSIAGVRAYLRNPNATPANMHEFWHADKKAAGWKYGPVKDAEKKQHPCMLPYDELPPAQRVKDRLFLAVVGALCV